jgi:hypothetical protein
VALEASLSSTAEVEEFGRWLAHSLAARREWIYRLKMNCVPLPPAETKTRRLPLEGAHPIPWRIERDPRVEITLALPRDSDEASSEQELETTIEGVVASMQQFLDEQPLYGEMQINGVVARRVDPEFSNDEQFVVRKFELTVLTI